MTLTFHRDAAGMGDLVMEAQMQNRQLSRTTKRWVILLAIAVIWVCFINASTFAADFIVNTTADTQDAAPGNGVCADSNGLCSLRAAITEANASPDADMIILPNGTYTESLEPENENANVGGDFDITSP